MVFAAILQFWRWDALVFTAIWSVWVLVFAALCQVWGWDLLLFGRIEAEICWYLQYFGNFNAEICCYLQHVGNFKFDGFCHTLELWSLVHIQHPTVPMLQFRTFHQVIENSTINHRPQFSRLWNQKVEISLCLQHFVIGPNRKWKKERKIDR